MAKRSAKKTGSKKTSRSRRKTPTVIDAHGHVDWYGYDADRLVENMDEHGIDVMWLLTWECPPHEIAPQASSIFKPGRTDMPVEDVLEAVQKHPDRFVPFYAPDPRRPDAMRRFRGAVERWGVRGCGEMKCRIMMDAPDAMELWQYCGEQDLPVIFHVDVPLPRGKVDTDPGYWYCCDLDNLARALETCSDTVFIGHAPGFWREISGDADDSEEAYPSGPVTPGGRLWEFMDSFPNLWCDLSAGSGLRALGRSPETGREFLLRYQDRCLFARDYFDGALREFISSCKLPKSAEKKILSKNALRLVPLD